MNLPGKQVDSAVVGSAPSNWRKVVSVALAAAWMGVVLVGCSNGTGATAPQGNARSTPPANAEVPVSGSPTPIGTVAGSSAATAAAGEFCTTFSADQKLAAEAIARAFRRPSSEGITMEDLQAARSKLQTNGLLAPPELQLQVKAQIGAFDDLIAGLKTGNIEGLDLRAFKDAQKELQQFCRAGG